MATALMSQSVKSIQQELSENREQEPSKNKTLTSHLQSLPSSAGRHFFYNFVDHNHPFEESVCFKK